MLTADDLRARVRCLNALYQQLAVEKSVPPAEDNDPLLYLERQADRDAVARGL
jgi:hypothetical protein